MIHKINLAYRGLVSRVNDGEFYNTDIDLTVWSHVELWNMPSLQSLSVRNVRASLTVEYSQLLLAFGVEFSLSLVRNSAASCQSLNSSDYEHNSFLFCY